jgi:ATP-binding cassette subfamily G (WHITE) protein 2 (PDR)
MTKYVSMAGGIVYNPNATQDCEFCQLENTNQFLASVSSFYGERWRNFGLMWVYIVFNVFGAVFLYWLIRVPKGKNTIKTSKELELSEKKAEKK